MTSMTFDETFKLSHSNTSATIGTQHGSYAWQRHAAGSTRNRKQSFKKNSKQACGNRFDRTHPVDQIFMLFDSMRCIAPTLLAVLPVPAR